VFALICGILVLRDPVFVEVLQRLRAALITHSSPQQDLGNHMCGILGVLGEIETVSLDAFRLALDSIAHRGPDSEAIWRKSPACLGHRRLAIIDLSDAGVQPMVDPDTGLVIVFNGEIYNYLELRAELVEKGHRFRTATDTEVLLKGYTEWGAQVLDRCNGMWAFAIWDPVRKRAFLARDRFGVKPLYYAIKNNRLLFASEPKALHALDVRLAEPEPSAVVELVMDSRSHAGERTFYREILALPSAHYAIYDAGEHRFALHRFWDYPKHDHTGVYGKNHDECFAELLHDAVRLRLRSDVPIGLTLSGGLDSSAVLAASRDVPGAKLRCYTSVYSADRSEQSWAETAARCAQTTVEPVEAPLDDWWSMLVKIVQQLDSPGCSPAVMPLWFIMARAQRDAVPVILEGQGADELLAGYTQYAAIETLEHLKAGHFGQVATSCQRMLGTFTSKWTAAWLTRKAFPNLFNRLVRNRRLPLFHPDVLQNWRNRDEDQTLSTVGKSYDPLRAALWRDHAIDVLPNLLHYGDSVSMAHGIESRLPFMDYRIVEWVFRERPPLLEGGHTKTLVRTFLRQRQFNAIADRKDKLGYPMPMFEWYRKLGTRHLAEILADTGAPLWDIMQRTEVEKLAKTVEKGSTLGMFHLFKILTTDIWLRDVSRRRQAV
jgi:asparagine synthase (glutamine-hydrolysing)